MMELEGDVLTPSQLVNIFYREMAMDVGDRETNLHLAKWELDDNSTDIILMFFQNCAQKKKHGLNMGELHMRCELNLHVAVVLYAAISLDLFHTLYWAHSQALSIRALQFLRPITSHNERLNTFRLEETNLTAATTQVVTDILVAASNLECLEIYGCHGLSEQVFGSLLVPNDNLKRIRVDKIWEDTNLSQFLQRVFEYHPFLQELDVRDSYCGNLSIGTIASYLPQHKNLEILLISDPQDWGACDDFDDERYFTERDFTIIADVVKSGTTGLRQLTICCEDNAFCGNRDELEISLFAMLQANVLLGILDIDFGLGMLRQQARFEHCQDMNWAGRVLVGKCPRSLWATVLERVNNNKWWGEIRKANALYNLLRESDMAHMTLKRARSE
jgi:hypothetical protein